MEQQTITEFVKTQNAFSFWHSLETLLLAGYDIYDAFAASLTNHKLSDNVLYITAPETKSTDMVEYFQGAVSRGVGIPDRYLNTNRSALNSIDQSEYRYGLDPAHGYINTYTVEIYVIKPNKEHLLKLLDVIKLIDKRVSEYFEDVLKKCDKITIKNMPESLIIYIESELFKFFGFKINIIKKYNKKI
jgi:hypothetical protein